jgi:hypothetical protein
MAGLPACGKIQNSASGVKTPGENAWFMSELKLLPPKIRPFYRKLSGEKRKPAARTWQAGRRLEELFGIE